MDALLSFEQVSFSYRAEAAPLLRQVSFSLRPGRIMAVLGPNGVGKTTLLRLALGWLSPQGGEIHFQGEPLARLSRRERACGMAFVPQNERAVFGYNVLEYVLMGRTPHLPVLAMPTERDYRLAWQALEQVGLEALAARPLMQLSGGERQLALLARAIAQSPRLFLLDEPTAHLDLHNKSRLIHLLRGLRADGATLLMTNHEPEVVLALADDVLLIMPERGVQAGPLEEMFTEASLSRVYGLSVRLVRLDGRLHLLWT